MCSAIRQTPSAKSGSTAYQRATLGKSFIHSLNNWLLTIQYMPGTRHARTLSLPVTSDSETPQTTARQAPLSVGLSQQEYWSGLPFPPPGDLPNPVIKPMSPVSPALAGTFFTTEPPGKPFHNNPGFCCSVARSCLILYDPMDCSLPGSSVHKIIPARILEWVAISSSRGSS